MVKTLTFDIESMANLVWSWQTRGKDWSAIDTELKWYPLGVGVKWEGEDPVYLSLDKQKGYKPVITRHKDGSFKVRKPNVKPLMKEVWEYLDEADVVVGFNSKAFDIKKLQDYFLALGMKPFSPVQHVDVMQEKKKLTSSNSNTLDYTSQEWGYGRKQSHEGWPLWIKCAEGDTEALRLMEEYCLRDVEITEQCYHHVRPWMKTHPANNVLDEKPDSCPKCGEGKMIAGAKYAVTRVNKYQYFRCSNCGASVKARAPEDTEKPLYT